MNRDELSQALIQLISDWGAGTPGDIAAVVEPLVSELRAGEFEQLLDQLEHTGSDWDFFPASPFVRQVSRRVMGRVLDESSSIEGDAQLGAALRRRVLLVGNHLSYVDVNVFDYLCHQAGQGDFADRMTTIVGPKVYTAPIRRLASLCFGTIKTPQSSSIASGEAVMPPREVARLARQTLQLASERIDLGDPLVLFPEGSRSRSGALHACLPAAARYLEISDLWIMPFGHHGCEKLVPLEEDHVYPNPVHIRIGPLISARKLLQCCGKNRGRAIDVVGFLIASNLPVSYRGHYADSPPSNLEPARAIASELLAEAS